MTTGPAGPPDDALGGGSPKTGAADLPTIEAREVMASNPLLSRLLDAMGLGNRRGIALLLTLVTVPAIALGLATLAEGRLQMGSVTAVRNLVVGGASEPREILGMSFLGDTMVWPFFVLVPLTLLLLRRAGDRVARFFSEVRKILDAKFVESNRETYSRLIGEARDRLAARDWSWRLGKYLAIAAGVGFCAYNFVTCTFTDLENPLTGRPLYPYVAEVVFAKEEPVPDEGTESIYLDLRYGEKHLRLTASPSEGASPASAEAGDTVSPDPSYERIRVDEEVALPKWDTDPGEAPLSWLLTRLWVLFGYGLIPVILYKVINLMTVLHSFCSKLTSFDSLDIKPLAPDRAGGLSSLSDAGLSFIYVIIPILIMAGAGLVKEATPPSPHNYLLMVVFLPLLVAAFFVPLSSVHNAMKRAKEHYLAEISKEFNRLNSRLFGDIARGQLVDGELEKVERSTESLEKLYRHIEKLPEWPLALTTVLRFLGATFLIPLVLLFLETVLSEVLS